LNINELSKSVNEIIKESEPFLRIAAEEIANKLRHFCEQNDIEKNTEEFDIIMNYGNYHTAFMFEFHLNFEKLRIQTEKLKNLGDL